MMNNILENIPGNPSAIYKEGRQANFLLEKSRKDIASVLSCDSKEIIFTNGGTESDNLAILGTAREYKSRFKKPRIIVSQIEHPAILESVKKLEKEGFEIKYIGVNKRGIIKLEELEKNIYSQTILISIMYTNNEIGTIQPIKKIPLNQPVIEKLIYILILKTVLLTKDKKSIIIVVKLHVKISYKLLKKFSTL